MFKLRGRAAFTLLAALIAACGGGGGEWGGTMADSAGVTIVTNPARADWRVADEPVIEVELAIGAIEGAPEYQFGTIAAIDVADDGSIFVLDQQAAQVRVFDERGTFVRFVGRPGPGPGELSAAAAALLVGTGDTVYVYDAMKQRLHRFAPDGADAGGVMVPMSQGMPVAWAIAPQRRFVSQVRPLNLPGMPATDSAAAQRDLILLRDARGEVTDTLLALESGRTLDFSGGAPRVRLFESEPIWALLDDGRIVHGRNDSYSLEVVRADGTLERIIRKPFERQALTDADRDAFRRLFRQTMASQVPPQFLEQFIQNIEFADHYPAYARILGGPDNTIWVQRVQTAERVHLEGGTFDAQDVGAPEWDVFDGEGRLLGTITLPPRFQPMRVSDGKLYGVARDELDVQHVLRLGVR
jgi:hypothetical protein